MIDKIKKLLNRIGLIFAFGMKGGDDLLKSQNPNETNVGIVENVESKNLGEALMKGEVTQQVQEFRYSNYKILRESDNYAYIGGGNAIKKHTIKRKSTYSFYQDNGLICESLEHELNRLNEYSEDRYAFNIVYRDITRFRLEEYITYGKFDVNENSIIVNFYFDKSNKNSNNIGTYTILKELEKIKNFNTDYQIRHCDICSNPMLLSFITYKANGEDDIVQYTIKDLEYYGFKDDGINYILSFSSNNFSRVDLTDKFFNAEQERKYQNKEAKSQENIMLVDRVIKCSICGNEMNTHDADITRFEFGKPICTNCLKKINLNN